MVRPSVAINICLMFELRLASVYNNGSVPTSQTLDALLNDPSSTIASGDMKCKHMSWNSRTVKPSGRILHQYTSTKSDVLVIDLVSSIHIPAQNAFQRKPLHGQSQERCTISPIVRPQSVGRNVPTTVRLAPSRPVKRIHRRSYRDELQQFPSAPKAPILGKRYLERQAENLSKTPILTNTHTTPNKS